MKPPLKVLGGLFFFDDEIVGRFHVSSPLLLFPCGLLLS